MIRRCTMAAGVVVLVGAAGLWIASQWQLIWFGPRAGPLTVILSSGGLQVSNMTPYAAPGWTAYGPRLYPQRWWPHPDFGFLYWDGPYADGSVSWSVAVPLWIPVAAGSGAWLIAWLPGRGGRAHRRRGRCEACGYDRRGLGAGAACPECGRRPRVNA